MNKDELTTVYEITSLFNSADKTFPINPPTGAELLNWIEQIDAASFAVSEEIPESDKELIIRAPIIDIPKFPVPDKLPANLVMLDPVIGGVLIAGLGGLLTYIATERRHREALNKEPPKDICGHEEEDGDVCNLPITIKLISKGKYLLRSCTKKPVPHYQLIRVGT